MQSENSIEPKGVDGRKYMVTSIVNFKLITIRTMYRKAYEVEGNVSKQHLGGDW